nr:HAD-IA family hydrolase [bacterium]
MPQHYHAVLFDMDGVLVDSEPPLTQAAIDMLSTYGVNAKPMDFKPFTGMGEDAFIRGVAEKYGLAYDAQMKWQAYERYFELIAQSPIGLPGGRELIHRLHERGIPVAIGSCADRVKVEANLRAAGLKESDLGAVVTGSDVALKKPNPDIYLAAAGRLGVPTAHCLVVEDAISGIQAALTAGMGAIGITTAFDASTLLHAGALAAVPDLAALSRLLDTLVIPFSA